MKYIVSLNGKKYEVEVEKGRATAVPAGPADPVTAPIAAAVKPRQSAPVQAAAPAGSAGSEPVRAPMPGKIIRVDVQPGMAVRAGDTLFILEALKMENEIVAPRDGVIGAVSVTAGETVETGAVLTELK